MFDDFLKLNVYDNPTGKYLLVEFSPLRSTYNELLSCNVVTGENVDAYYLDNDYDDYDDEDETTNPDDKNIKAVAVEMITITKLKDKSLHYTI